MFKFKKRAKSVKKVTKSAGNSPKVCKQKTITKTRTTAGSHDAVTPKADQRSDQLKLNSVEQYTPTETISSHVFESTASDSVSESNGRISNGDVLNRRTYSLEQVSRSLDEVMASGKAILDALRSVNSESKNLKGTQGSTLVNTSEPKSRVDLTKRATYDLNKVSDLLDSSVDNCNSLEDDISNGGISLPSLQRNTYDLDIISTRLDANYEQESSLEEILLELSMNATESDSTSSTNRDTYDLEKVATTLDESIKESLQQVSLLESEFNIPEFNKNRRGTYDLSDVSGQLDNSMDTSSLSQGSNQNTAMDIVSGQSKTSRRETYDLSDVSDLLDDSVNSGKSTDDSLDKISSNYPMELKRRTYDLTTDANLRLSEQSTVENISDNNNTITATKQLQTNIDEVDSKTSPNSENLLTDIMDNETETEKRNTYILDDSDNFLGQIHLGDTQLNSGSLTENGQHDNAKRVNGLLSELGLDRESGQQETELTPGQWMDQMHSLKTPPPTSTPPSTSKPVLTASPISTSPPVPPLKLNATKVDAAKEKLDIKSSKQVFHLEPKQRSQTFDGAPTSTNLDSRPGSEMRTRSLSDSKIKMQLKSSSSPNFSSTPWIQKTAPHHESMEDISPGIQNYLANKLGLSEEQCIAVHRRLSNGSETVTDASKLANRKTYSLDDLAHSLDIATSQGLPMTKVLDNLDDPSLENTKATQKLDNNSTGLEEENMASSVDNDLTNTRPRTLDLESNTGQSKVPTKTYSLVNGSSFVDGSPTGKLPTTSLDNQFKLVRKKAVYKPSAKLQSFSHLLGGKGGQVPLRGSRGNRDPLRRNTYTLESVAESLEKAQDAGVPMLDALKRLSGSCQGVESELSEEKRKTYSLEDVSKKLEIAAEAGLPIVDTLRTIADPSTIEDEGKNDPEVVETPKPKRKPPPKPKRTFSNSSKPEIKFVSDSFVIEYYTSPERSQSESSAQDRKLNPKENLYVNQSSLNALDSIGVKSSPSTRTETVKDIVQLNKVPIPTPGREDQKPTSTKVVHELDTLLLKLAAEVEKPTNVVDTSHIATNLDSPLNSSSSDEVFAPGSEKTRVAQEKGEEETNLNLGITCSSSDEILVEGAEKITVLDVEKRNDIELASNSDEDVSRQKNELISDFFSSEQAEDEELSDKDIDLSKTNDFMAKPDDSIDGLSSSEKVDIMESSSKSIALTKANDSVKNKDFRTDPFKLVPDDEFSIANPKPDDEGYCSLSRKPSPLKITWSHASDENYKKEKLITALEEGACITEESGEVEIICTYDKDGESQEGVIRLSAEDDSEDKIARSDLNNASPKADPVSRELNLLRLRLAEKQRDIEAQKQRTKEQLEEERKRFGQNVFWLAVGKGRDKKEESEKNLHKKVLQEVSLNTESSNNNKFATFTKQSSLDEDLPPSMGKLQDRTFNLTNNSSVTNTKSIPEEKAQLPSQGPNKETIVRHSVEDRNPSDDIVQFRLSRQTPGNQDIHRNKELTPPMNFPGNLDNEFQNSQKPKTPVLNYKSRINVPVSFQAKTENYPTKSDSESSRKFSGNNGNFHDLDTNSKNTEQILRTPTSPLRKCWDTEAAVQSEPCIAVSESDYHVFEQNDANVVRNSGKQEEARVDNEMYTNLRVVENGPKDVVESGSRNHTRSGSDSSDRSEDDLKTGGVKLSPYEGEFEVNFDSSPVEEDRETPKKGLALFIGEENTVSNDGFTPEQLKKREKFLRNRQQKIEEDKLKKEALLEKKRRKEEKMREIQAHREREEQSRHAKLQEKREQAEHAKQERQKYEMRRKENPRTTYVDGTLGDHAGYTRTTVDIQGDVRIPGGNAGYLRSLGAHGGYTGTAVDTQGIDDPPEGHSGYARTHVKTPTSGENPFEVLGPAQTTTPSSFSGFTGVQSYVKPSGKTNRKLIINAISHVCLPGAVNKNTKEKCLQAMTESSAQHFLILFKEGLKFRALYSLDLESNQVLKVHGIGPRSVAEKMIEQLYKYNSGGKEFSKIPAKGFSLSVDGFTLQKSCWQSSKPSVQSKTASNYKHSRATR